MITSPSEGVVMRTFMRHLIGFCDWKNADRRVSAKITVKKYLSFFMLRLYFCKDSSNKSNYGTFYIFYLFTMTGGALNSKKIVTFACIY